MPRFKHTPVKKEFTTSKKDGSKDSAGLEMRKVSKLIRKPRRYRPGTVALREIRRYQKGTELLLPKAPCSRWIRELAQNYGGSTDEPLRFNSGAIEALRTAMEDLAVELFRKAQRRALDRKKITITTTDLQREFEAFQEHAAVAQAAV